MIRLPPLRIVRNELEECRLTESAREWLEKEDRLREPGIHASDLLDPRIGYFQAVNPKPLSERQIYLYLVGRVLHYFVLSAADPATKAGATDSGAQRELGILFSPDLLRKGIPIEVKTNRSVREPNPDKLQDDLGIYVEQLGIYLVLTNRLIGELWILYLNLKDANNRTFPEPRCYRIELTKDQFYLLEQQVLATRDALIEAKEKRDHKLLPLCRDWKCGLNCAWWAEDCRPEGRWPEKDKRRWKV